MTTTGTDSYDVLIAGGSFTGLTLAIALAETFGSALSIMVAGVEDASLRDPNNPRAFALSASSKCLLEALDLWSSIESEAQAVQAIELTDSPLSAGIRPVNLTYSNVLSDGAPASYIVPSHVLAGALLDRCGALQQSGSVSLNAEHASDAVFGVGFANVTLQSSGTVKTRILVAAEGREGALRSSAGLDAVGVDHDQLGIVAIVHHDAPHNATAVQHFLPAGPFAILPLSGRKSCVTWSEEKAAAGRIMQLGASEFLGELEQRFGGRYGELRLECGPRSFPLRTQIARSFIAPRFVLVGDSAHAVHPIAGQGLNLAYRDIAALTECLAAGASVGLEIADPIILERYESWRRFDSVVAAGVFAGINKLFANDWSLLRSVREVGLGAVQQMDGVKAFFVRHAAGQAGDVPKMLVGERLSV